jgi:hypothetical protein
MPSTCQCALTDCSAQVPVTVILEGSLLSHCTGRPVINRALTSILSPNSVVNSWKWRYPTPYHASSEARLAIL